MKPKPKPCTVPGDSDVTAAVALMGAILLLFAVISLTGCATVPNITILPGGDNVTITATVTPEAETMQELLPYAQLANAEAANAMQLYMQTKNATTLQQLLYWTAYASGIALQLEQINTPPEFRKKDS